MTVSQLINRLQILSKPDATLIIYDRKDDYFFEIKDIVVHKDGNIELRLYT